MSTITNTLKPLLYASKLTFFFYNFQSNHKKPKTYFLFLIIKLIVLSIFSYSFLRLLLAFFIWPIKDINISNNINLVVTSLYVIITLITTTKHNSAFNKFLQKIVEIDKELKLPEKYNKQLYPWIYTLTSILVAVQIGYASDNYYHYPTIQKYLLFPFEMFFQTGMVLLEENINVAVVVILVKIIHKRFEYINQQLLAISNEINSNIIMTKLRWLRSLHMKVGKLIEIFNSIFGLNLLMLFAMFFAQFILTGFLMLLFMMEANVTDYMSIRFAFFLSFIGNVWIVCHVCHQTQLEVNR